MRRISVFVIVAFLAGFGVGYSARSAGIGTPKKTDTHAADLAAIEKLHQEDIEVTLSQDPKGLVDIFTEDAVRLMPGEPPVVGKEAIRADNEKNRAEYPGFQVLRYAPEYKDIQIADGSACEWGEFEAQYKLSPEGPPVSMRMKALRVLRRQSDGSWKFALVGLK
jgi:uncharacterized protein (TIGR02246 family)